MMRRFYNISMAVLIVLACSNRSRLEAQQTMTPPIASRTYTIDDKTINLVYRVGIDSGSASLDAHGNLNLLFDTKTTKAQFFIEFQKLEYGKAKGKLNDDYKMVIPDPSACVSDPSGNVTNSNQGLLSLEWSKTNKVFSALKLNLSVRNKTTKTDNIFGRLVIKFRILSTATDCVKNPLHCKCVDDYSVIIPYEIDNVISEERQKWLDIKDQSLKEWCESINDTPNGPFAGEAIEKITGADDDSWGDINKQSKSSLEKYLNLFKNCGNYTPKHQEEAQRLLQQLKKDQSITRVTPKDNWSEVLKTDKLAGYQDYIAKNPDSPNRQVAEEAIRRLSPITWEWEEGENGYKILKLQNVKRVRFKDISTGGKLAVIDTSALLEEQILSIKFDIGNKYKLKIEDTEWNKDTIIEFDRAYTPKFTAEQSVFRFAMKGGIAPFRLALRNVATNDTLWSVGDIQEDEYNLNKADLLKYIQANPNLCGLDTLRLEPLIWESEVFEPQVMAGGSFQLPVDLRSCVNWLQWIITGLVVVIAGLLFSIFFIVRRRRNSPKTTFDRR